MTNPGGVPLLVEPRRAASRLQLGTLVPAYHRQYLEQLGILFSTHSATVAIAAVLITGMLTNKYRDRGPLDWMKSVRPFGCHHDYYGFSDAITSACDFITPFILHILLFALQCRTNPAPKATSSLIRGSNQVLCQVSSRCPQDVRTRSSEYLGILLTEANYASWVLIRWFRVGISKVLW